ncbi:MAG: GIY-YIG nuclease family protein [Ignavibacteriae bacterium]|nr:GIY-YIG nuclease family protein [Ignavibacteriota bacterium]
MFFTYIIQSEKDNSFYIGFTSDLEKRLKFHNEGLSPYTSKKIPWKLVYFEQYNNKSNALKREYFLKKQKNKEFYLRLIKNFTES